MTTAARDRALMDVGGSEAFLHGVFAIAITLLVLDIHVPAVADTPDGEALVHALREQVPHYLAYVLGFMFLGTYWIATHRSLRQLRGVDHWFLVIGLVFLLVVSALPFATGLLAEYIGEDQGRDKVALVVFTVWQLILAVVANVSLQYANRGRRLLRPSVPDSVVRRQLRVALLGPVVWIIALGSAIFLDSTITLLLMGVLLVIFIQETPAGSDGDVAPRGSD